MFSAVITALLLVPGALAHGIITIPSPRAVGPAGTSACGQAIATAINADNTSYVEQLTKLSSADSKFDPAACDLYLCKGLQFADNSANVQTWKAGDVVPIKIWLRIPHEGIANVSIVSTKQNKQVGDFLKLWTEGYAPGKTESDVPLAQTDFNVTVPSGLETTCANAGDCVSHYLIHREDSLLIEIQVLQWWWLGTAAKQTYESCVDFKIAASDVSRGVEFKA